MSSSQHVKKCNKISRITCPITLLSAIGQGVLNFDAKVRRALFEPEDLFLGYIAGMDIMAQGLRIAYRMHFLQITQNMQRTVRFFVNNI